MSLVKGFPLLHKPNVAFDIRLPKTTDVKQTCSVLLIIIWIRRVSTVEQIRVQVYHSLAAEHTGTI